MENLNAEQVKKWLEVCAEDTPYPDQRQALLDALTLIKQLTEENEKWKRQFTALDIECERLEKVEENFHKAKTEVAREIFEEIEEARERWEAIYSNDHFGYGGGAYGYLETDVDHTIYDLKKKYIGEEK